MVNSKHYILVDQRKNPAEYQRQYYLKRTKPLNAKKEDLQKC